MASISLISLGTDLDALNGKKISGSNGNTDTSNAAADSADALKNQFLSILLTQMQNQNPLDPMDTKEFTGQLTQFSSLEQQIDTNTKLDSLLSSLNQSSLSAAFGYIGQYVDLDSATSTMQESAANWTYALPSDATSVEVTIKDANGNILYKGVMQDAEGNKNMGAGTYNFGITNEDLTTAQADGAVLTMSISALDKDGKAITTDIHTTVKVDSVQSDSEGTYLQAGGLLFEISDVKKIVTPPKDTETTTV